ncbi:MAG: nucleoid-associated protein, YbaB/EbfC family [Flavobacteriales bacterium]|nr:nucleoid-associated protein, YbaB/EbfC family [Flavobacteriales bacterium]|tara:strand:- start:1458 stop:1760 length:303 start_codon:yes stop_codon:yes gene_type:complete
MFGNMMGKLQEAQQKMEEVKSKLDQITVIGEAQGVKVSLNGNKVVTSIDIPQMILDDRDKDQIEDLLILALNKGLENAENVAQSEGASAMKGMLPNIPGL